MDYSVIVDNDDQESKYSRSDSTHALHIDDNAVTTKRSLRTYRRNSLACLFYGIFALFLLFVTLFAVFYIKFQHINSNSSNKNNGNGVCLTANCVKTAAVMLDKMDQDADPCQDFSQYACGKFYKDTVVPDNQHYLDLFSRIINKNMDTLRLILEKEGSPEDLSYVTKMRQFYGMCLDSDTVEEVGLKPYLESKYSKEWPTLNSVWDSSNFDLNDVITKYESLLTADGKNFFTYHIGADPLQSNKNILKISQPSLCLHRKRMKSSRNDSAILACQQYYVDVALALGADDVTAREDARDWVDFEISLAQISEQPEETKNMSALYNPMTLAQMTMAYPPIDWHRVFHAIFETAGVNIGENTTVINESPTYFTSLETLLKSTSNRLIQNKISFNHAVFVLKDLTRATRDASLKLSKHTTGVTQLVSKWKRCVKEVKKAFHAGLAKQFVSTTFSQQSKIYIESIIHFVKIAFHQQLQNASWMGQKTKEAAIRKMEAIKQRIGYPNKNFSEEYIDKMYTNITIKKDKFYETRVDISRQLAISRLHAITRKVDNSNWQATSMEVNFQNLNQANEIRYFAGILQPNFFSETFPSSVNFGAIGAAIGHELIHFFDSEGSQYDEQGNVRNWWQPQDLERFQEKTQCLIDQYSAFEVPEIDTNLNGKLTVGENTADNGGIKAAYRAYKQFSMTQPKELPLPGLGLTVDQQFYLAAGQLHCSVHTKKDLEYLVSGSVHPPGKYRILGTFRNSEDFARKFNCPLGSPMNPDKKCDVW